MNRYLMLIVVISVFNFCGCASIVSSSNKILPIMTQPDEATCEIIDLSTGNAISKVKTPNTVNLDASSGFFQNAQYKLKISKEGYIPHETVIESDINGWYYGNIIFGGLLGILIVDPATGAMWKISDDNINVKLYQDNPEGRLSMASEKYNGKEALVNKDYEKSINDTTYGISISPNFYDGYCVRGAAYAALGEIDKALDDINKAIFMYPQLPTAYNERARIYISQNKIDKAIEDLNKALVLKPDYSEALFQRGYIYDKQNNKEMAKYDLKTACNQGFHKACNFQF